MGSFKLSFALVCILSLATLHTIHAQNSQQDYLDAHNAARTQVGVANIVWNANQRIGDCNLVHSGGPYGENLAEGSGTFTGTATVNLWVGEKTYYDHGSNTCASGHVCGHYTQVVWRNSTQLGCARVQCTNNNWWFVICSYYPPGNYNNQFPY